MRDIKRLIRDPRGEDVICRSCKAITHYRFKDFALNYCVECYLDLKMIKHFKDKLSNRTNHNRYTMKITLPCELNEKLINN